MITKNIVVILLAMILAAILIGVVIYLKNAIS